MTNAELFTGRVSEIKVVKTAAGDEEYEAALA